MRIMDKDGLLLCQIQGKIFERSIEQQDCSSSIFIRRYMYSDICRKMDQLYFLDEGCSVEQVFEALKAEYGASSFGKLKFSKEEMYWMGYIYRYFSYVYAWDSKRVYKIINATELRKLYFPYHTLDPLQAITRILEAKEIQVLTTEEAFTKKGVEILRRLRKQ